MQTARGQGWCFSVNVVHLHPTTTTLHTQATHVGELLGVNWVFLTRELQSVMYVLYSVGVISTQQSTAS